MNHIYQSTAQTIQKIKEFITFYEEMYLLETISIVYHQTMKQCLYLENISVQQ